MSKNSFNKWAIISYLILRAPEIQNIPWFQQEKQRSCRTRPARAAEHSAGNHFDDAARPKLAEFSKDNSLGAAKIGEFNEARMKALSAEFEKEYFTALYSAARNFLFQTTEALHVPNVRILIAGRKSCHASRA